MQKNTQMMGEIPKKIHYVWMGGAEKSEMALRCIESWKAYMPEYEIIEWNESNFDVDSLAYTKEAYRQKKWAFVSDVVRTYALKEFGGVYFDTDVELFSDPNGIFDRADAVFGFDTRFLLSTGVMATVPHHPIFEQLWAQYTEACFTNANEEMTINTRVTFLTVDYVGRRRFTDGTYFMNGVRILPRTYFSNNNAADKAPVFAIHHFAGTWKTKTQLTLPQYVFFVLRFRLLVVCSAFLGNKAYIRVNDSFWRKALRRTERNLKRNARIYKVL